ncbi:MAG: helix-turn-helix domain-containing protein [Saprospiraceae bacterium]
MSIGTTIKELRKLKKIKQTDFAEKCGITTTYLSLIENNKKQPSQDVLNRISDSLEIPYPILAFLSMNPEEISEDKRELYLQITKPFGELLKSFFITT